MSNQRLVVPIVAAVVALIAWLIWRHSFVRTYDSLIVPVATFVGVLVLGHIAVGVFQGMKEASKQNKK